MKPGIKIIKIRPTVTEAEIRRTMDFDSVLRLYKTGLVRIGNWTRGLSLGGGAIIVTSAIYLVVSDKTERVEPPKQQMTIAATDSTLITPAKMNLPVDPLTKQVDIDETNRSANESLIAKEDEEPVKQSEQKQPSEKVNVLKNPSFDYVEAEPIEGYPHLYAYFASELRYPEAAVRDSIQGTLSASFIVTASGQPDNILIENSLGPLFDLETNRLIQNMPAWKPATINGKPVPVRISLPLTFQIIKLAPTKQK